MIPSRPEGTGSSSQTPRGYRIMHSPIASKSKQKSIQHGSETVKKSPDRGIQNTALDSLNNIMTTESNDGGGGVSDEDWTPENDAIMLLRSRLQVQGRYSYSYRNSVHFSSRNFMTKLLCNDH